MAYQERLRKLCLLSLVEKRQGSDPTARGIMKMTEPNASVQMAK